MIRPQSGEAEQNFASDSDWDAARALDEYVACAQFRAMITAIGGALRRRQKQLPVSEERSQKRTTIKAAAEITHKSNLLQFYLLGFGKCILHTQTQAQSSSGDKNCRQIYLAPFRASRSMPFVNNNLLIIERIKWKLIINCALLYSLYSPRRHSALGSGWEFSFVRRW